MFDFDKPEYGSEERFEKRSDIFDKKVSEDQFMHFPKIHHYGLWILHNCVAHPLIGLMPLKIFFDFHDYTSELLNNKE